MKPLFGVAVFGLLPVPPMPARDAGDPDDRPSAAEDLKRFELESHTNDNKHDEPAPVPSRIPRYSPRNGRAVEDLASRVASYQFGVGTRRIRHEEPSFFAPIVLSDLAALCAAADAGNEATTRQIGGTVHTVVGDNPIGPTRPVKEGDGHPKNQPIVPHETAVAMATRHHQSSMAGDTHVACILLKRRSCHEDHRIRPGRAVGFLPALRARPAPSTPTHLVPRLRWSSRTAWPTEVSHLGAAADCAAKGIRIPRTCLTARSSITEFSHSASTLAMTAQATPSKGGEIAQQTSAQPRSTRLGVLAAHLAAWCETCTDYYDAAATFEELSSLSDAELQRRGLSRATLARDVCTACDRNGKHSSSGLHVTGDGRRDEQVIAEDGRLGLYMRGWSEADPTKIIEATAEGYDFYDPFVGRFSRHTLTQYFALLRARFSVGRVIRWPELAFNLRGPMQSTTSEARHQYWRDAPMLGLTGASSIAMTHAGVVSEIVTYDLNIACDWLRR